MSMMLQITGDNFATVVESDERLFLVDFYARWCGPCKALAPVLQEIADSYGERVGFAQIDIEAAPGLAERFGVRAVPTLLLMRKGLEIARIPPRTRTRIAASIDENL
jgi:thioredoxin